MVFSSIPAYLDPANWQQQQPNYQTGSCTGTSTTHHFHPPLPPPPPPPQPHGVGSGTGSIRPGSMADRARMANLPMPEVALKCPRCESTNTKFCYFNNYSLSQPRHFCKTCRRYWTRGGALRSVPVGGGCRRNKRSSKGSSSSNNNNSKSSPVSSSSGGGGATTSYTMIPSNSSSGTADIIGLGPQFPPLRFMSSNLHNMTDHYGSTGEIGLNYGGLNIPGSMAASTGDINFFLGNSSSDGGGSFLLGGGLEHQWRLPQPYQFPFLAAGGLDLSHGLFPVEGGGGEPAANYGGVVRPKTTTSEMTHELGSSVKAELITQDMNLSRQFLGIPGNEQYWSGPSAAWTDLSGFSSSSTSHPL